MPLAAEIVCLAILGSAVPGQTPAKLDRLPFVFSGEERAVLRADRVETPQVRQRSCSGSWKPTAPSDWICSRSRSGDSPMDVVRPPSETIPSSSGRWYEFSWSPAWFQPDYLLEGPFVWPAQPLERRMSGDRRFRTLSGQDALAVEASRFRLFSAEAPSDALCEASERGRWQCVAVPTTGNGILQLCSPDGATGFADVSSGHSSKLSESRSWSAHRRGVVGTGWKDYGNAGGRSRDPETESGRRRVSRSRKDSPGPTGPSGTSVSGGRGARGRPARPRSTPRPVLRA